MSDATEKDVVKLYKVTREHRYNGGNRDDRFQSEEVLYCGYDRLEAIRVYHENNVASHDGGPGSYYEVIKCRSRVV